MIKGRMLVLNPYAVREYREKFTDQGIVSSDLLMYIIYYTKIYHNVLMHIVLYNSKFIDRTIKII